MEHVAVCSIISYQSWIITKFKGFIDKNNKTYKEQTNSCFVCDFMI